MELITKIENLHWKFSNEKNLKPIRKRTDFELQQIRNVIKSHKPSNWFAISSDKWYEDVTYLLKFRKLNKEKSINRLLKEIERKLNK